jgi:hypothetical protein
LACFAVFEWCPAKVVRNWLAFLFRCPAKLARHWFTFCFYACALPRWLETGLLFCV